jgi:hypothetical protein
MFWLAVDIFLFAYCAWMVVSPDTLIALSNRLGFQKQIRLNKKIDDINLEKRILEIITKETQLQRREDARRFGLIFLIWAVLALLRDIR